MKYEVTLETKTTNQYTVVVEASTENEASLAACDVVQKADRSIEHTDVLSVVEVASPRRGYIARIL